MTNRTDEVTEIAERFCRLSHRHGALFRENGEGCQNCYLMVEAIASAITSAVEAETERCAKVAENGMAYSSGIEIATAIRQTPTQGER